MYNQISLFIMLLTPVIAYVAGAVIFSFIECLRKGSKQAKYNHLFTYRNGL